MEVGFRGESGVAEASDGHRLDRSSGGNVVTKEPSATSGEQPVLALPFGVGHSTSVGSLPHLDVDAAIALVLETHPDLPAAPTLPARSPLEGMLAQAAWGIEGVTVTPAGELTISGTLDPAAPIGDPHLEGEPFTTLQLFLQAVSGRTKPIKLQCTGPVTLGLALSLAGAPEAVAFEVAGAAVAQRVRALISRASDVAPAAPLVVVLDEPALVGTAQLGFPLRTEAVVDLLSGALAAAEPLAITGVHCCGVADWRAVLMAGPQLLSMPVGAGATACAGAIAAFIERGGWIAWGAVPTSAPIGAGEGLYWKALSAQWCELVQHGCDPVRIRRQSLITPECGLVHHDVSQASHVLGLCSRVAARLQDQAVGLRLSVGA